MIAGACGDGTLQTLIESKIRRISLSERISAILLIKRFRSSSPPLMEYVFPFAK